MPNAITADAGPPPSSGAVPEDPIEAARLHAVGLAALASLLGDDRVHGAADAGRIDRARADAIGLLTDDVDALLALVWPQRAGYGNALRSSLGQLARAAEGAGGWADQSDEVLIAQGRASTSLAPVLAEIAAAHPRLHARLVDGGSILDVGTGTAALACALAERFAEARVVGIDIATRPLALAAGVLHGFPELDGRIVLRQDDVTALTESSAFDLIWLPTPFLAADELPAAYRACARALTPGGRLVAGLSEPPATTAQGTARRWLAELSGRSDVTPEQCRAALGAAGFGDFGLRPTVPGGPLLLDAGLAPC